MLLASQQRRGFEEHSGALGWLPARPVRECGPGRFERPLGFGLAGLGGVADDLGLLARVEAVDPRLRGDRLAANPQRPLTREFAAHLPQRRLHYLTLRRVRKVSQ